MLSYYDTLSFAVRKKSFLAGLCISLLMFLFFTLICFSLEKNYAIFSNFKRLLMTTDKMALSIIITKIVVTLGDITFKVAVSKKIAWILLLFISFNLVFFSWQTITSKKDLFHQTSRSSIPFYFI